MVTSKHNEKVPPVGDDERRHQLQRIYDKISALVYVVIHAVVGAFMPKNCLSRASSLDTQGEKKIRLRSFRRIPRALWGRGHEVIPLRSHMPSLLLQKHHQENNRSELVLLKKNSWWWVALLKKKKEPSSWWWLVLRKELKISRWWLMLIKKKRSTWKAAGGTSCWCSSWSPNVLRALLANWVQGAGAFDIGKLQLEWLGKV